MKGCRGFLKGLRKGAIGFRIAINYVQAQQANKDLDFSFSESIFCLLYTVAFHFCS